MTGGAQGPTRGPDSPAPGRPPASAPCMEVWPPGVWEVAGWAPALLTHPLWVLGRGVCSVQFWGHTLLSFVRHDPPRRAVGVRAHVTGITEPF